MAININDTIIKKFSTVDFSLPQLSFNGEYIGKTTESLVYDGDTFKCLLFPLNGTEHNDIIKLNIRLSGIDTPEIRSKDLNEKKVALIAKAKLISLLNDCDYLHIEITGIDKYGGRYDSIVTQVKAVRDDITYEKSNITVNELIVQAGLAYKYDGGTKLSFNEWCDISKFINNE